MKTKPDDDDADEQVTTRALFFFFKKTDELKNLYLIIKGFKMKYMYH